MRKTRILAALLCIMMVVCSMPLLNASAAVGDTYASVDAIMGFPTEVNNSLSYNFVGGLTAPAESTNGPTGACEVEYGAEGMTFNAGGTWYATPAGSNPYVAGTATVISAKLNAGGMLCVLFNHPAGGRLYSEISENVFRSDGKNYVEGALMDEAQRVSFSVGTDWFDAMYVVTETGYRVYVKNASTNGEWRLLSDFAGTRSGNSSGYMSIVAVEADAGTVKSMTTYGKKTSFDSVEEIAGGAVYNDYHHLLTTGYNHPDVSANVEVNYTAEGMELPTGSTLLWYLKNTTPWYDENITVLKGKFGSANDTFEWHFPQPQDVSGRTYLVITPATIRGTGSTETQYLNVNFPVDEWFEILVHAKTSGHEIYVKEKGKWKFLYNFAGYRSGTDGGNLIAGTSLVEGGLVIQSVDVYKPITTTYNGVDAILGGVTGSSFAHDFNEDFSFANTPGRTGYTVSTGVIVDEDGMTFGASADLATASFTYYPFTNWSPLNAADSYETGYERQAFYMVAKGDMKLQLAAPTANKYGLAEVHIAAGDKITAMTAGTATTDTDITVFDEWVEYLIVPNGTDDSTKGTGYTVYAKGDASTGGAWVKVVSTDQFYSTGTKYLTTGITITGLTGHVKKINLLAMNRSAADAETVPAGADYLYFSEEFDAAPTYVNKDFQTVSYVDGDAVLACNDETGSGKVIVKGLEIPVNGYAEFKARTGGKVQFYFYDGEKYVSIMQQSDYGSVTGSTGYTAASTGTWKTWRVKRTADGYTVYGKSEGDSGWYVHTANVAADSTAEAQFNFVFDKRNDGADGDSQLSYIKVYGSAPTGKVTLTDGYNTNVVADGDTAKYYGSLRAIVNEDAGKLLVVTYKGDDMLKAQIVNVADMADDQVIVNAAATDVTKIKVFLWDSFSGLNRMTPAVTLNL